MRKRLDANVGILNVIESLAPVLTPTQARGIAIDNALAVLDRCGKVYPDQNLPGICIDYASEVNQGKISLGGDAEFARLRLVEFLNDHPQAFGAYFAGWAAVQTLCGNAQEALAMTTFNAGQVYRFEAMRKFDETHPGYGLMNLRERMEFDQEREDAGDAARDHFYTEVLLAVLDAAANTVLGVLSEDG